MPALIKMNGLFRCALLIVGMRPGTLLAQIHLHVLVRIQSGPFSHAAKSMQVEGGAQEATTRPSSLGVFNVVDHLLLRRIRAGKHVRPGNDNPGFRGDFLPDFFHIHIV